MIDPNVTLAGVSGAPDEAEAAAEAAAIYRARRDPSEFAALYRLYVERVFYYVLSRADSRSDAEDITAQVFLDALESLPAYRHRGHFAAWLFTIARHRLADFYRGKPPAGPPERLAAVQERASSPVDLLAGMIQAERLDCLSQLLKQLDERERELLRLRFAAGLSFAEIAALVGSKESAVKMRYYRLLDRLQSQMETDHA
jgi:RNA polymerase sigma-70 factor (ECF subfamily)